MTIRISALYRYPIKSCKGHAMQEAPTDVRGIVGDRSMMIVDINNEFITQREMPRMALIEPALGSDGMALRAPGMEELRFGPSNEGRRVRARVWKSLCDAVDQGNDAALWLQEFLAAPVRLVRIADGFERRLNGQYARSERDQTGFADGYPFLLISQASLDELNARLASPVPMDRFRPNIVVEGCAPFAEDGWRDFRIGDIRMAGVKLCPRCPIPTIDQARGEVTGREPIKTLATFRTINQQVMFGQNVIAVNTGVLRVGDAVEVLPQGA
jgi:uncharacterized protein YcbX